LLTPLAYLIIFFTLTLFKIPPEIGLGEKGKRGNGETAQGTGHETWESINGNGSGIHREQNGDTNTYHGEREKWLLGP